MSAYDYLFKFIMVGDSNVGKTCMLTRYVDGWFKADNDPTIGVEFGSKITTAEDGTVVRIQVWDTAGQESFRAITKSYYRGAIAAILVYDVTKRETFESLPTWLNETLTTGKNSIVLLMIGNKTDLAEKRQVTTKEAQDFAKANKILFMETSAKNGDNIEKASYSSLKAFECVKNIVLDRIRKGDINPKDELGVKEGSLLSKKFEEETAKPGKRCC